MEKYWKKIIGGILLFGSGAWLQTVPAHNINLIVVIIFAGIGGYLILK